MKHVAGVPVYSDVAKELAPDNFKSHMKPSEMTLEEMIELFGDIKRVKKFWEKMEGYCKEVIRGQMPEGENTEGDFESEHYMLEASVTSRTGLNTDKIKEEMDEEWLDDHTTETTYQQFTVKEKA